MSEFRFHSISGEQKDRNSPNFACAFILTISRLEAVERLPALHYSVDFIVLVFGIIGFIVELWNH